METCESIQLLWSVTLTLFTTPTFSQLISMVNLFILLTHSFSVITYSSHKQSNNYGSQGTAFLRYKFRTNFTFKYIYVYIYIYSMIISLFLYLTGFPGGISGKQPTCQCRRYKRCRFNPWVRKIPWRREWQPLQYSCLGNPMDRGAWRATVHGTQRIRHD